MKKLIIILTISIFMVNACQTKVNHEQSLTDDNVNEIGTPFKDIVRDDIKTVELYGNPPQFEITLSDDEITEFTALLNKIVVYEQVSPEDMVGGVVQFTITKSDGSNLIIKEMNPIFIIDDIWYKAKNEPLEALNQFAHNMAGTEFKNSE